MTMTTTGSHLTIAAAFWFACVAPTANATQACNGLLPSNATEASAVFICNTAEDRTEQFACRDYRANGRTYRVLLQGGAVPRHAFELTGRGTPGRRLKVAGRSCTQPRPQELPSEACFRGSSVCLDEHDQSRPCNLFEYTAEGEHKAPMHYLVMYAANGSGSYQIEILPGISRSQSIAAELAFAIGQAMAGSDSRRAQAYIEHAVALVPTDHRYISARLGADPAVTPGPADSDESMVTALCAER